MLIVDDFDRKSFFFWQIIMTAHPHVVIIHFINLCLGFRFLLWNLHRWISNSWIIWGITHLAMPIIIAIYVTIVHKLRLALFFYRKWLRMLGLIREATALGSAHDYFLTRWSWRVTNSCVLLPVHHRGRERTRWLLPQFHSVFGAILFLFTLATNFHFGLLLALVPKMAMGFFLI